MLPFPAKGESVLDEGQMLPFPPEGESVLDEGQSEPACIPSSARAALLIPSEISPATASERPVATPRQAVDTIDIRSMMKQETARLRQHMSTLMSRHEKVIASLLEVHLGRQGNAFSTDMTSAANGLEDVEAEIQEGDGSEHGQDSYFNLGSAAEGHVAKVATRPQVGQSAVKNQEENDDLDANPERSMQGALRSNTSGPASSDSKSQHFHIGWKRKVSPSRVRPRSNKFIVVRSLLREKAMLWTQKVPATSCLRTILQNILKSASYDSALAVVLMFNLVLIVWETDLFARCHSEGLKDNECIPMWMFTTNLVILSIYTVDSIMVLYVKEWHILIEKDRLCDLFVVVVSWLDIILVLFGKNMPSLEILRLARITRLLRMSRMFELFPELRYMVMGFVSAMRAMGWGLLLLMLILIAVSVVAVELVHPATLELHDSSETCAESFQSVWFATLFYFQTAVAGDSWGLCTLPIIRYQPLLFLFLGGSLIAVQAGVLNLIMSVIIDRVAEARENDKIAKLKNKEQESYKSRQRWTSFFRKLDTDGNGTLSLEELLRGFDEFPEFEMDLKLLGLERDDISTLLVVMDEDHSGSVSQEELVTMFNMVLNFDPIMHQVSMGQQLRTLFQLLEHKMFKLSQKIDKLCQNSGLTPRRSAK